MWWGRAVVVVWGVGEVRSGWGSCGLWCGITVGTVWVGGGVGRLIAGRRGWCGFEVLHTIISDMLSATYVL